MEHAYHWTDMIIPATISLVLGLIVGHRIFEKGLLYNLLLLCMPRTHRNRYRFVRLIGKLQFLFPETSFLLTVQYGENNTIRTRLMCFGSIDRPFEFVHSFDRDDALESPELFFTQLEQHLLEQMCGSGFDG